MLYTQNRIRHFRAKSIFGLSLFLSLWSLSLNLKADEKIIIPRYDSAVMEDGADRWKIQPTQERRFVIKRFELGHSYTANKHFLKNSRYDRKSNHIPMTFSIYSNGYCVFQEQEHTRKLWSFKRTTLKFNHRPTLYLGFQQDFF